MNNNFYAIEIASASYDERYLKSIQEAQLANGKTSLLEKIIHLITHAL